MSILAALDWLPSRKPSVLSHRRHCHEMLHSTVMSETTVKCPNRDHGNKFHSLASLQLFLETILCYQGRVDSLLRSCSNVQFQGSSHSSKVTDLQPEASNWPARIHLNLGKIRMKRIMLIKMKQTTISISHSSQLTDFLAFCSNRSDSVFNFSKFWSAIRRDCDKV